MRAFAVTDDDVLVWWEELDAGASIAAIAQRHGRAYDTVFRHLDELGVVTDPLVQAALAGELPGDLQAIFEALGRISTPDDLPPERRSVAYAKSMQHVLANRSAPVVQSGRQRRQDSMATSRWRAVIRRDMRRSGLLPRG